MCWFRGEYIFIYNDLLYNDLSLSCMEKFCSSNSVPSCFKIKKEKDYNPRDDILLPPLVVVVVSSSLISISFSFSFSFSLALSLSPVVLRAVLSSKKEEEEHDDELFQFKQRGFLSSSPTYWSTTTIREQQQSKRGGQKKTQRRRMRCFRVYESERTTHRGGRCGRDYRAQEIFCRWKSTKKKCLFCEYEQRQYEQYYQQ